MAIGRRCTIRILWVGVGVNAKSGYGVASKNIISRLKAHGHEVTLFTMWGLIGQRAVFDGVLHVPLKKAAYGIDVIADYVHEFQPDIVLQLYDEWPSPDYQRLLGDLYCPWVVLHYSPVELPIYNAISETWRQFAFCEWAADELKTKGLSPRVVYLGVDTHAYRPLIGEMDSQGNIIEKGRLKQAVGADPDDFLIGMVAANIDHRKALEPQIRVYADFAKKYKDVHLYIKTNPLPDHGGWDVRMMCQKLFGLSADDPVAPLTFPEDDDASASTEQMALWYNAFDVFLNCAMAEGIGLPALEANSCGIPALGTDFSAMREYSYGWHLPYTKVLLQFFYAYGARVDEQALWDALEQAYNMRGSEEFDVMKVEAREHACMFNWDTVVAGLEKELEAWMLEKRL